MLEDQVNEKALKGPEPAEAWMPWPRTRIQAHTALTKHIRSSWAIRAAYNHSKRYSKSEKAVIIKLAKIRNHTRTCW